MTSLYERLFGTFWSIESFPYFKVPERRKPVFHGGGRGTMV